MASPSLSRTLFKSLLSVARKLDNIVPVVAKTSSRVDTVRQVFRQHQFAKGPHVNALLDNAFRSLQEANHELASIKQMEVAFDENDANVDQDHDDVGVDATTAYPVGSVFVHRVHGCM
jgi:hypothetical protein